MTTDNDPSEVNAEHAERMRHLKKQQSEQVRQRKLDKGVLIVNTGDGKGKSTAAFGVALRAVGVGHRVGIVQFIKGTWKTGEKQSLARIDGIDHVVSGEGFTWNTQDRERDIAAAERGWQFAMEMLHATVDGKTKYQLVILDELNIALRYGYLDVQRVVDGLSSRPEMTHVIVTGRNAPRELIEIADTVTEMKPVKHAFEANIRAQKGIEF